MFTLSGEYLSNDDLKAGDEFIPPGGGSTAVVLRCSRQRYGRWVDIRVTQHSDSGEITWLKRMPLGIPMQWKKVNT